MEDCIFDLTKTHTPSWAIRMFKYILYHHHFCLFQTQIQLREREMELNHYRAKLATRYSSQSSLRQTTVSDVTNTEEEGRSEKEHK